MPITYPTIIDVFPNPVSTDLVENATSALDHWVQHSNANDAIEALEAKVGATTSLVTTSHDYKLQNVTGTDKAVSDTSLLASLATFLPPGTTFINSDDAVPSGFLACDGSAVSRTAYAALFAVIGTTYGTGDGSTTFNVPFIPRDLQNGTTKRAAFDNYSRSTINTSTTHSVSHVCAGLNRLLVVSVLAAGDGTTGVTYNGVAMTKVDEQLTAGGSYVSQWYLVAPTIGTNTITATTGTSVAALLHGLSFGNMKQTSPLDVSGKSTATGTSFVSSLTTTVDNDLLVTTAYVASNAFIGPSSPWETIGPNGTSTLSTFYNNHILPKNLVGGFFNVSANVENGVVKAAYFVANGATENSSYLIIKT